MHELLDYESDNEFAIMMLAEIKILNKHFTEAIHLLNTIKTHDNNSFDLYRMLLISYSNIGDYENEILLSTEIIENFPFESIGYESLAILYIEKGEYINTIDILNKAIEIFPEEYYFFYYLGLCYRNTSQNREAINYFLQALKINPQLKNVMRYNKPIVLTPIYNCRKDYELYIKHSSDSIISKLYRILHFVVYSLKYDLIISIDSLPI